MFEQLLAALTALTAALNANTAARGAAPAAAAPAAGAPAAAAPAAVTVDQVKAQLAQLMDKKGKDAVVAVLAACNAKKLGDVKPEQLPLALAKATELLNAPAADLF